jgi:hypothetical protein
MKNARIAIPFEWLFLRCVVLSAKSVKGGEVVNFLNLTSYFARNLADIFTYSVFMSAENNCLYLESRLIEKFTKLISILSY